MKKVLVVMGSDSDFDVMKGAFKILRKFGVEYKAIVCSAHRTPYIAADIASTARDEGYGVIIAAAGLAAHLPGVLAAYTILPVIGVPISAGSLKGVDALYSIVQMPTGIPVATVSIDGAANSAILAIQILATAGDSVLSSSLEQHKADMIASVKDRNESLEARLSGEGF